MNMDAAFGKARVAGTDFLGPAGEFARLEADLEKLLAKERPTRRHDGGVRQLPHSRPSTMQRIATSPRGL